MVMQDKNKRLDTITKYCFFILLFGYMILSLFKIPMYVINIITGITSCVLYITILIRYNLNHEKMHNGLLLLGILCITASIFSMIIQNKYMGLICTVFVYIFYLFNQKLMTGKWNKFLIFFDSFVIISSLLSIYFNNKLITVLFLIIEFIIYARVINQLMFNIGMKRKQQLEESGFTKEDEKKVSLIRRILFGRTGKLDLTIVEMITGKDFSKKSENKS